jgi:putative sigma-54 modulation protein
MNISSHNIVLSPSLNEYINKRVKKLEKYISNTDTVHIILSKERYLYTATIELHFKGANITAHSKSKDSINEAIDDMLDKCIRQIKEYKEKELDRKTKQKEKFVQEAPVLSEKGEGKIDKSKFKFIRRQDILPLNLIEAAERLEASNEKFILFLNIGTEKLNLLYKSEDGKYEIIEYLL